VNIPEGFDSKSWRTAPPHTKHFKTAKMAAVVCAMLNRELIENSKDGTVRSWNIRIKAGSGYGVVSMVLRDSGEWTPRDEYDLPPAFIRLDGDRQYSRSIVGELNVRLENCPPQEKRMRAYIARSIHPGDMEPYEQEATPETQAVPQTAPAEDKPIKRYQFTGELVSISDPVEQRAQAINRLQGEIR
tara:strand:+ start:619 stop:1179 length:561 start_codon:yes stop_codon:yes gene_type:complete